MGKGDLIGGSGLPVGTPSEVRALGQGLDKWGTCSGRGENLKSRGCNHFQECIFGFKGKEFADGGGPRNVGVYIKTDTGASVEREMPCHVYMETLHARAMSEGTGETIAVVAHEGETITITETISVAPHSKTDSRVKTSTKEHTIRPFPRPGQEGSAMGPEFLSQQKIEARLKDRNRVLRQLRAEGIDPASLVGPMKETVVEKPAAAGPPKRG